MLPYGHMSANPALLSPADPLAAVWRSLADPTRRAMLDRLRAAPMTTGQLAAAFPQSRYAIMKHLDVLVAARMVVVRRRGRERWNHLDPIPLQRIYERWVRPYEALWAAPLVRFTDAIEAKDANHSRETPVMPESEMLASPLSTPGMLTVTMEIPIAAPAARVWTALTTEVGLWWPHDFLVAAEPQRMQFEPRLGGRLFEEGTLGGGVVWYTVYGIAPGVSIDLAGNLSPAFGGPAQSLLHLSLREKGATTILALTDAVVGNVGPRSEASLGDGWRAIFERGLKAFLEAAPPAVG